MKRALIAVLSIVVLAACEPVDVDGAKVAETTTTSAELPPVLVQVLVAKVRVEKDAELTDDLVETLDIEKKYVTADMLSSDQRGDVIGRVAEHPIPKGALLHDRDFRGTEVAAVDDAPVREPIIVAEKAAPKREVPGKATAALFATGEEAYFGTLTIQPGAGVPVHRDPTEEFLYVLEGGGTMTIDGTSHEITAGMAVYMPADAEVSFQNGEAVTRVVQAFGGPGPASKYDAWKEVEAEE